MSWGELPLNMFVMTTSGSHLQKTHRPTTHSISELGTRQFWCDNATMWCRILLYSSFCDKLKSEESLLLGIKMKFWRFTRVLWKATFFGCHTTVPNCRNSCSVCPAIFSTVHAKKKYQIWLLIPYQVFNIILQTTGVVGKLSMKNFKYWHLVFYSVLQWFITLICCRIITIFIWIFPQHRNLYSFSLYQA